MKKSMILIVALALVIASSSVMAAITWTVTASPAKTGTFAITVDGQIVANPVKIVVQPGAVINIQNITPAAGYYLDNVKKDGKVVDKANLTFTSDTKSHKIVLGFKKNLVITTSNSPKVGGTIEPSGKVSVEYGKDQLFMIAPATSYDIKSVKADGKEVQLNNNSYTFSNVVKAHKIGVVFALKSLTVTSSVNGGNGKISPAGEKHVNYGKSLVYTATPDKGYNATIYIDGIIKAESVDSKPLTYKYENITSNSIVEAVFVPGSQLINLSDYMPALTIGDTSYLICTKIWTGEVFIRKILSQESIDGQIAMKVEKLYGNEPEYEYLWYDTNEYKFFGYDDGTSAGWANSPMEFPMLLLLGKTYTYNTSWIVDNANQGKFTVKQTLKQKGSITVPAGIFDDCILITQSTQFQDGKISIDNIWYAKGIGQVYITYGDGSVYELTGAKIGDKIYGTIPQPDSVE